MPLLRAHPEFLGTDAVGAPVPDYCKFCFQNGAFTDPRLTMEEMIQRSVRYMTDTLGYKEEAAIASSNAVIPGLKRWHRENPYWNENKKGPQ